MIIQNFHELAFTPLRKQALLIADAGYQAINTQAVVRRMVRYDASADRLRVGSETFELGKFKKIVCIGFGKAAFDAVSELHTLLGPKIDCGFVLDLKSGLLENIVCRVGTHPYPTEVNVAATRELLAMIDSLSADDLVLCVVSGGGSSLLCDPIDISCETETRLIQGLTSNGASIAELNTVRKHISGVKGGNLAKICHPATTIGMIFSDVPGNDLSLVASGPTVKDTTTVHDAAAVLKKYNVLELCELPSCRLIETPKDNQYFEKVHNVLMVSANHALEVMRQKAEALGFHTSIYSRQYEGEAREVAGDIIARSVKSKSCLLGAGETTVHLRGVGRGGRNQEMALAALPLLDTNSVFVPLASDGRDNTDAAGAVADSQTQNKARHLKLDPATFLQAHTSFDFFEQTGDLVYTGRTGSNVSDFFVYLKM